MAIWLSYFVSECRFFYFLYEGSRDMKMSRFKTKFVEIKKDVSSAVAETKTNGMSLRTKVLTGVSKVRDKLSALKTQIATQSKERFTSVKEKMHPVQSNVGSWMKSCGLFLWERAKDFGHGIRIVFRGIFAAIEWCIKLFCVGFVSSMDAAKNSSLFTIFLIAPPCFWGGVYYINKDVRVLYMLSGYLLFILCVMCAASHRRKVESSASDMVIDAVADITELNPDVSVSESVAGE